MNVVNVVLLFYLLIGSSYIGDLYSGQVKNAIQSNVYVKHLIAFSIILILTKYVTNFYEPYKLLLYALVAYILFVTSTKLDLMWNILILILLIVYYLINNKFMGISNNIMIDQTVSDIDKERIANNMQQIERIIICAIIVCIIIGGTLYLDKKVTKFDDNFDAAKYIFYPPQKT